MLWIFRMLKWYWGKSWKNKPQFSKNKGRRVKTMVLPDIQTETGFNHRWTVERLCDVFHPRAACDHVKLPQTLMLQLLTWCFFVSSGSSEDHLHLSGSGSEELSWKRARPWTSGWSSPHTSQVPVPTRARHRFNVWAKIYIKHNMSPLLNPKFYYNFAINSLFLLILFFSSILLSCHIFLHL